MKTYTVKLTYKYTDTVKVKANSQEEAKNNAVLESNDAQYESLYDAEVLSEED